MVAKNSERKCSNTGARIYEGTDEEMAVQQSIFTRRGVKRALRFAFNLGRSRRKHLTSATKSNGIIHTMPFWDECFRSIAPEYPEIRTDQYHIDILTAIFVLHPDGFDVSVCSNHFCYITSVIYTALLVSVW